MSTRNPFDLLPGLRLSLYFPLKAALEIVEQRFAALDDQFGVSVREFLVLVAANEREINQGSLAECLRVNKNMMVKLIDVMETKGIIRRVRNPKTRREWLITVTPKGKNVVNHFHGGNRERTLKAVYRPLTPDTAEQVLLWACDIINAHYEESRHKSGTASRRRKPV